MANDESQVPAEGSKMDALVKVVLVFFISLLSFSVGTFVGKQVSDSDHRRAALEGDGHGDTAHTDGEAHEEHAEDRSVASLNEHEHAVSETDVNNLADEFVEPSAEHAAAPTHPEAAPTEKNGYKSFSRKGEAPAKPVAHEPAKPEPKVAPVKPEPTKKSAEAHTSPAVEKILKGEAPTTGKVVEEKRQPSNVLPTIGASSVGKYTVQVGSYATENEAKQHATMLKGKGWNAFYIPADIKGKTWFRVSVGLFDDSQNAKTFMQKFQQESNTKSALVQKIVQ